MLTRIIAAAAVLLAFAVPSSAQPCTTVEQFLAGAPEGARNRALIGEDAQAWLNAYNSIPPVTHFEADRMVFVYAAPGRVVIGLFSDGCGTKVGVVSAQTVKQVEALIGTSL